MTLTKLIKSIFFKPAPKPKRKYVKRIPVARARNDSGERIESLRFTVPALRVGVLEYAPGQLTTDNPNLTGKTIKLYYPPESVSDKKFLKSLETAPVVVGGHDSTTSESNKKIDGWAHTVSYDNSVKAAMISGIVKGNKEIAYIKSNLGESDFGASAFVDIFEMEVKDGVTPDGQEYTAIAKDLKATHVALSQHVRDPQNKIKVTNAVVVNTGGNYNSEVKSVEMTSDQIAAIVENAVKKAVTAKNESDRIAELESAIIEINEAIKEIKEAMEMDGEGEAENCGFGKGKNAKGKNADVEPETKSEEGKEKKAEEGKEDVTLENAKPAQALIAAVGTALNIDFGSKTPSFATIANMLGIKETDPAARIIAVNAKFSELSAKKLASAENSKISGEVF